MEKRFKLGDKQSSMKRNTNFCGNLNTTDSLHNGLSELAAIKKQLDDNLTESENNVSDPNVRSSSLDGPACPAYQKILHEENLVAQEEMAATRLRNDLLLKEKEDEEKLKNSVGPSVENIFDTNTVSKLVPLRQTVDWLNTASELETTKATERSKIKFIEETLQKESNSKTNSFTVTSNALLLAKEYAESINDEPRQKRCRQALSRLTEKENALKVEKDKLLNRIKLAIQNLRTASENTTENLSHQHNALTDSLANAKSLVSELQKPPPKSDNSTGQPQNILKSSPALFAPYLHELKTSIENVEQIMFLNSKTQFLTSKKQRGIVPDFSLTQKDLVHAIVSRDVCKLRAGLKAKLSVNTRDETTGMCLIHLALVYFDIEVIKCLVKEKHNGNANCDLSLLTKTTGSGVEDFITRKTKRLMEKEGITVGSSTSEKQEVAELEDSDSDSASQDLNRFESLLLKEKVFPLLGEDPLNFHFKEREEMKLRKEKEEVERKLREEQEEKDRKRREREERMKKEEEEGSTAAGRRAIRERERERQRMMKLNGGKSLNGE